MSNYSNRVLLIHFIIDTNHDEDIKESLYQIFSRDLDYIENEEYFRKNTLKLGYKNEADRLVTEYIRNHDRIDSLPKVERAVKKLADMVFDSNHYGDYQYSVEAVNRDIYSVSLAYSI